MNQFCLSSLKLLAQSKIPAKCYQGIDLLSWIGILEEVIGSRYGKELPMCPIKWKEKKSMLT